jgi:hypothetical protein
MFSSKTFFTGDDKTEMIHSNQSTLDMINSTLNYSTSHFETKAQNYPSQVPQPAPRRQLFETKDIDLSMNIDDLLAIN